MARAIYEIKLKDPYFPAESAADALELFKAKDITLSAEDPEIDVNVVVNTQDTVKLFVLAKTMYDTERFELNQIRVAVKALAGQMGYYLEADKVTECVLSWAERFDEMELSEIEEWIIG